MVLRVWVALAWLPSQSVVAEWLVLRLWVALAWLLRAGEGLRAVSAAGSGECGR